ncbi:MAG: tetratricopeptide repeat protein [Azospirillaceae bacterium]|nr:tetratricopeptide repeat protein [Azospirillaceae bacterium]
MLTIEQALNQALSHHGAARLAEAEALYRQILAVSPEHPDALHWLGFLAHQVGRHEVALQLMTLSLSKAQNIANYYNNLGQVLSALERPAAAAFHNAVVLAPEFPEAYVNLAPILARDGQTCAALALIRRVLLLTGAVADTCNSYGLIRKQKGDFANASAGYRQALALDPAHSPALNNLGNLLRDQNFLNKAAACYRKAVTLKPGFTEAYANLGAVLQELGRLDEAVICYRKLIELNPSLVAACTSLGSVLQRQGRLNDAVLCCRRAVAIAPDSANSYVNLVAYATMRGLPPEQRCLEEAIRCCRRAIKIDPTLAEAHYNLATPLLLTGQFHPGWQEYEWRWKVPSFQAHRPAFPQAEWQGEPLAGRTILLYGEQGFGDFLQFVRYAPLVAARGARIVLRVPKPLIRLLKTVPGISEIIGQDEAPPPFDYHQSLMSLPGIFGTDIDTIPATIPYFRADPAITARWQTRLSALPGLNVGLVWAGNPRRHDFAATLVDQRRSIALEHFAPLATIPGIQWISLQKGPGARRSGTPPGGLMLHDWMDEIDDFADTAALIEALDLVVTVDTSVAHLAGALGKPVWILSRYDGCWRWLLNRDDTPWYPTARLFRQDRPHDWDRVIDRVRDHLAAWASTPPQLLDLAMRHDKQPDTP